MSSYLRYPHIHDDLLTFVAADDVWLAPVSGGRAWRLTDDRQPVRNPRFSPDGTLVAFTSFKDGHPEAYVVATDQAAAPRRLTWWGARNTLVLGWTADGRVLVGSSAGETNVVHLVVKSIGLDGTVDVPPYGPAWGVAIGDGGRVVVSTPGSRPPALWKRYRGGTAPRLWMDRAGEGSWSRLLPDEAASLVDPMWVDGKLAFVSDRAASVPGSTEVADGQANLWVFDDAAEPSAEPRQVTAQGPDDGYVRDATTDGSRVVWHSRGRIIVLESLAGQPEPVDIVLPGAVPAPRRAEPTDRLTTPVPDHGGDASLIDWRGNAFWLTHRAGPARALVADSSVRIREPALLGQTGFGVVVTDDGGVDSLEIHHLTGDQPPRRLAGGELGRVLHVAVDPAGERLATISHDGRISLVDVEDGSVTSISTSTHGEAMSPSFSPDGRYLLWSQPSTVGAELHQLMLHDVVEGDEPVAVTSGTYHDHGPRFSRDGKHIVFLSERTFDPHYDAHEFALSFSGSTRPWLIPLSAEEPPPFGPHVDGWAITAGDDGDGDAPADTTPTASAGNTEPTGVEAGTPAPGEAATGQQGSNGSSGPTFDADGSEERAVPFPVPSRAYQRLETCDAGVLWIEVNDETGALGTRRAGVEGEPTPNRLRFWSWKTRQAETIVDAVTDYAVSGDGKHLVVRHQDSVVVVPSDRRVADGEPDRVAVDLSRLRFDIEPRVEWAQMFDETTRLMRDHYWRADMDGVDWDAVVERWRPVVAGLSSHDDLVDLLWEVVGELNTSHAYVAPAETPGDKARRLGLLGADLSPVDGGWRIDRILYGESSDPSSRSPLRAAGVGARVGDVIVAVDGTPVDPAFGPGPALIGAADKPIELTLARHGSSRRVVVVPLDDEEALRYQDWVRSRRDYVRSRAEGRLGYVHIPDMMSLGWAQFHRDFRHATKRDGLIVDVRYNRGGHTSQLVLARLSQKLVGWGQGRHYDQFESYPDHSPRGPVVLVANEYAGSDGDIINAAAQAVGLGPTVGVRTWGGVVGIDGRFDLVDGTMVTQPRYAFWMDGKGWAVENHGVDPDVEVVHDPADFFGDADPQLDRAIAEALSALEREPAATPPSIPEPRVR